MVEKMTERTNGLSQNLSPYSAINISGAPTHGDIYKSFAKYGYPLFSHLNLTEGKLIPLEKLILEVLDKTTQFRELEGIPVILNKNKLAPVNIIGAAKTRNLIEKTGYICELSWKAFKELGIIENNSELTTVVAELYPFKSGTKIPLVGGLSSALLKNMNSELEKKWGVLSPITIDSVMNSLRKR